MYGTIFYTLLALIAFAANSVLCRLALGGGQIDAASFTILRLLSGIIMLMIILGLTSNAKKISSKGSWLSATMLFIYVITFSFAYISLDTATGALILFATVQITIIVINFLSGNKLHVSEWIGILIAFTGFVYLMLLNISSPSFNGFILMAIAGFSWGIYTLRGKNSLNPLQDTAFNFARTMPLIFGFALIAFQSMSYTQASYEGIILAIISGAIASGIGYTIWYRALTGLSATEAAVVQLLVPIIAAIGGVIFVSEIITARLVYSGLMILGGILIVMLGRYYFIVSNNKIP